MDDGSRAELVDVVREIHLDYSQRCRTPPDHLRLPRVLSERVSAEEVQELVDLGLVVSTWLELEDRWLTTT